MRLRLTILITALSFFLIACSENEPVDENEPFSLSTEWENCTNIVASTGFEELIGQFECTKAEVPLNWDSPADNKIDYWLLSSQGLVHASGTNIYPFPLTVIIR